MQRNLAAWLAANPGGAVVATGLLGLLPLFGVGFAFFLPGAVPALVTLVRGERLGLTVALGASALLTAAMVFAGRPVPVGLVYAAWVLGPPLALAWLLRRTGSLSMCLQVATLAAVVLLVVLHASFGDPEKFWAPFVRDLAAQMRSRAVGRHLELDGFVEALARTLWGWVVVLTLVLAMCALFLGRWWQSQREGQAFFGPEFQSLRLGQVLGACAAMAIVASLFTRNALVDDLARLFLGALVLVGLAAAHRAVAVGRLNAGWLWAIYALLLLIAPLTVVLLASWGFLDNWSRSRPAAATVT